MIFGFGQAHSGKDAPKLGYRSTAVLSMRVKARQGALAEKGRRRFFINLHRPGVIALGLHRKVWFSPFFAGKIPSLASVFSEFTRRT